MRRLTALLLTLTLLFLSFACQKTPESPIVVGKDQTIMLERAQQTSPPAQDEPRKSVPLKERLACPERVVEDLSSINDIITIRIDADVRIPDVDKIPVVRTHAADFSQETVSMLFERLCANANLMEVPDILTKSQIEQEILAKRRALDDSEYADSPNILKSFQERIAALEALHPTAPETITPVPCNGLLTEKVQTSSIGNVLFRYTGINAYNKNTQTYFHVQNNNDLKEAIFEEHKDADGNVIGGSGLPVRRSAGLSYSTEESFRPYTQHPMQPILDENAVPIAAQGKLTISPKEARQLAETVLAGTDMVVRDIYLTDDENLGHYNGAVSGAESYAYRIYCVRQTAGIMQSFVRSASQTDEGMMSSSWHYEILEMLIGNEGIIDFDWQSPHTVGEAVVEDAALLPFEEIMKIFNKMLPITSDSAAITESYQAVELDIHQIVLELQRITEQNSIENGLLVPVWNFYGTRVDTDKSGKASIDHNGVFDPQSFLTINAIDGSIIDVRRGY